MVAAVAKSLLALLASYAVTYALSAIVNLLTLLLVPTREMLIDNNSALLQSQATMIVAVSLSGTAVTGAGGSIVASWIAARWLPGTFAYALVSAPILVLVALQLAFSTGYLVVACTALAILWPLCAYTGFRLGTKHVA